MKKILCLVLSILCLGLLFGCAAKDNNGDAVSGPQAGETEASAEQQALESEAVPEIPSCSEECGEEIEELTGSFNENGWLKILTLSGPVIPYEYRPIGEILFGDGSIKEEGQPLSVFLPQIYEELPIADRTGGFDLDIYEWGMAYLIDVFASDSEMLAHRINTRELLQLASEHDEELIVDVHIVVTGCVVDEWPEERCGMGYAFKLSAVDHDAEAFAHSGDEPFLRLYSNGQEVEAYEVFMYGASACYDDNGAPVGMLCADGAAFFDPDHIAEAYDTLPVCGGGEGLDIRLADGAEIKQIYVYDPANGFERTAVADLDELERMIADSSDAEFVVEIVVYRQGNYIDELYQYEYEANGYAFTVK